MDLVQIYQCLCNRTRLRILNVLDAGPLCVCHLQGILREPQVKISKHLRYLKEHGIVEAERRANWMIYRLPEKQPHELRMNLAEIQKMTWGRCHLFDAQRVADARKSILP